MHLMPNTLHLELVAVTIIKALATLTRIGSTWPIFGMKNETLIIRGGSIKEVSGNITTHNFDNLLINIGLLV